MLEILGVAKVVPVPNEEPPEDAEYQLMVPEDAAADNVNVPVPQRLAPKLDATVGLPPDTVITTASVAEQPLDVFVAVKV